MHLVKGKMLRRASRAIGFNRKFLAAKKRGSAPFKNPPSRSEVSFRPQNLRAIGADNQYFARARAPDSG